MSEDRTQAPTKRRRADARERGQAPHSPELTAAAGLVGAASVLWLQGEPLVSALLEVVRTPLQAGPWIVQADAAEVVSQLRQLGLVLARPLVSILVGFLTGALVAHQAQVQGLWAPALLAPDPTRLWTPGHGPGLATRAGRGAWALARAVLVAATAYGMMRSEWVGLRSLGALPAPDLARAAASSAGRLLVALAAATLALGVLDFFIQHRRFEALLRLTPEEHREDLRSTEGDPALRSRRRRISQAWRSSPSEPPSDPSIRRANPVKPPHSSHS